MLSRAEYGRSQLASEDDADCELTNFDDDDYRGWPIKDYINSLERLSEYDFLIEILANQIYRKYAADEIIQAIEKSGRKDLIQPLNNILSTETDSRMVAKLQQAIKRLESTN